MESVAICGVALLCFGAIFFQGYFLDKVSNNGIYYGVMIPDDQKDIKEINVIRKNYKKIFLVAMLPLTILAFILFYYSKRISFLLISIFVLILAQEVVYYFAWKQMKRLKLEKKWTAQSRNVVIIDIKGKKDKKERGLVPDKAFLYLGVFVVISIIISIVMYDKLPDNFPTHYNIYGEADAFAQKGTINGYFNYIMMPIMQIFMVGVFYYSNKYGLLYKKLINSGSIKGVTEKQRIYRKYMSIYLFVVGAEVILMLTFMQISMFYPMVMKSISLIAFVIIMISALGGMIVLLIIGQGGRNLKVKGEGEVIYRDDDDLYFLGKYYYNKQDPCVMIQKRMGIGTDFNYANRIAQVIVAILILFIIGTVLALMVNEPLSPF